jgi:alkaline phosphatase D
MSAPWMAVALALLVVAAPVATQAPTAFPYGVAAGAVSATTALLWTQLDEVAIVVAEVARDRGFTAIAFSGEATAGPERGGVVKVHATRLTPYTRYYYRFGTMRGRVSETGTFITAPAPDAAARLTLAFSGDADGTHRGGVPVYPHDVMTAIAADRPDRFVFLGDTVYPAPSTTHRAGRLDAYRAKYRESRTIPAVRAALRTTAVEAIWDDHEVANDFDPSSVDPARYAAGRRAFLEAWPIDAAAGRLYRSLRWGRTVELFILDVRSYRSPQADKTGACDNPPRSRRPDIAPMLPDATRALLSPLAPQLGLPVPPQCLAVLRDPARTLLGAAQRAWLTQALTRSDAAWKIVLTPVPIQESFGFPYDRWEGYAAERAALLNSIQLGNINGVVWLAADAHAVLVNDVRMGAAARTTGMKEVVAGPIASGTFGDRLARRLGPASVPAFAAFLQAPPPRGLGMTCAVLDRLTYGMLVVDGVRQTVTITPKDGDGRPVCRAPLVLTRTR